MGKRERPLPPPVGQVMAGLSAFLAGHWQHLLDLLFPPRCGGCRAAGFLLCSTCLGEIARRGRQRCQRCCLPGDNQACRQCRRRWQALGGLQAVAAYEEPLRRCIQQLKYQGQTRLAGPLGQLLAATYRAYGLHADLVIPVPLHAERQRRRGYNHACLLADACARQLGLPLAATLLERIRPTAAQVGLSPSERLQNVAGAFRCRPTAGTPPLQGRVVLLIDDVCTTGATLDACAAALRESGATAVYALVLAVPL
jgi:ComF family protein